MPQSFHNNKRIQPTIPARFMVGVTGHRKLVNESVLAERVEQVLQRIRARINLSSRTKMEFTVISPLAEGADRLVAREVLKVPGSKLEAVLPMKKEDYLKDFELPESRAEFEELFSLSHHPKQLPPKPTRTEAYAQIGRYIVDHCDVIIALWDGKPAAGKGGTAEVVSYAREKRCPLYWIQVNDGQIRSELENELSVRTFVDLDKYNLERHDEAKLHSEIAKERERLFTQAKACHFPTDNLREICEQLLPHFVRADILALKYQRLYFKAGSVVYALAAAAVGTVAFQSLFVPEQSNYLLIEVAFMIAVLAIIWLGNRQRWHAKWIDYRFLAERFRSAIFMSIAGVEVGALRPPRHLSLAYSAKDWMVVAFSSVWSLLPRFPSPDLSSLQTLREFMIKSWIEDQVLYHRDTSKRHHRRHTRLEYTGNVLFGLTFLAAVSHVLHIGPYEWGQIFAFMAIVFPAIAGALGAIRTHREYLRNAQRSAEMVRHLEELIDQMQRAENPEDFLPLVREAEETMLHENEDWRVVVRFHKPELPA